MAGRPYRVVTRCRICGNPDLVSLLHLGTQALTGVFPKSRARKVTAGPLELVKCREGGRYDACGLVQLRQSYDKHEMYGMDYGYRSGLNQSMVRHLRAKVARIVELARPKKGDLIVDIGSNDGTLLSAYPKGPELVGIDPTGAKFGKYYPKHVKLICDFFSAGLVRKRYGDRKAKVVTSIAMFYDLDAPLDFVREVASILADDGLWVLEQSYLPSMLEANAYDTICHEHLEYYALRQIRWMAERAGLHIVAVELNDVNGGSFSIALAKPGFLREAGAEVKRLLAKERRLGLHTLKPYAAFKRRVAEHRRRLRAFFAKAAARKQTVLGYGASTKGNVILQYCGLTRKDLPAIAEVNEDKFGSFTPGTAIPIISEAQARARKPAFMMVLPWHFRRGIVERERAYLASGGKLVFPLPELTVVSRP